MRREISRPARLSFYDFVTRCGSSPFGAAPITQEVAALDLALERARRGDGSGFEELFRKLMEEEYLREGLDT